MSVRILKSGRTETWTPDNLGRDIICGWFKASDHGTALMTDAGGGLLTSWVDRIGNVNMTAAGSAEPTWAATSFNSAYNGVTADGSANCLVTTSYAAWPTGSTPGFIMALYDNQSTDTSGTRAICTVGAAVAAARQVLSVGIAGPIQRQRVSDTSSLLTDASKNVFGIHMAYGDWSGTTQRGYIDGVAFSTPTGAIASLNTDALRARIFASGAAGATQFGKGVLCELIIGRTVLADALRQKIEGYWAWTYNLTSLLLSSHPYKFVRP